MKLAVLTMDTTIFDDDPISVKTFVNIDSIVSIHATVKSEGSIINLINGKIIYCNEKPEAVIEAIKHPLELQEVF